MITDPRLDAMFRCPKCGEYLELDIFGNGKCPKCSFIEPGYEEIPEGLNVAKHQQASNHWRFDDMPSNYPICANCGNLTIHEDGLATCIYAINCRKNGQNKRFTEHQQPSKDLEEVRQ